LLALLVTSSAGAALFVTTAHADPSASDRETARRLMAEGRERRDARDLQTALQSFQAADAIMQVPTTGVEVARTQILLGQLVEARDKLLAVVRFPRTPREPKPFAEARVRAAAMSDEIAPRIPSLRIVIRGAPEGSTTKVSVDGINVATESLVEPRSVNPGHHVVIARVVGGGRREATVDVREGASQEVVLALPQQAVAQTPSSATSAPAPPPPPSRSHALAWVGFSIAGAGIATGAVTGLLAMSKLNAARTAGCVGNECPPSTYPDLDSAGTFATVSTVGFIVGGAGAALGVVGLLVGGRGSSEESTARTVTPWLGAGSAGLRGTF
jgi:hypothetical protein